MHTTAFLSSAEAAYIAALCEQDIHRALDQQIVSKPLIDQSTTHPVSRLAAAFIAFSVATEKIISPSTRKTVLDSAIEQITSAGKLERALALKLPRNKSFLDSALTKYVSAAAARARQLDTALNAISVSDEVMGGAPVFKGTRVLVETVLGSLEEGTSLAQLKDSYSFLTENLVTAAAIYTQTRPPPKPTRRLSELHPDWTLKSVTIIHPEKNDLAPLYR